MAGNRKLEILAEAIAHYSGYQPGSPLFAARNPGGLKAYSPKHQKDEHGNRVFNSLLDGLQALIYDVELKVAGKSSARLTPQSTLADLAAAYGQPATAGDAWAKFLRKACGDSGLNRRTPLSFFEGA